VLALAGFGSPVLAQVLPFVRYTTSDGLQSNRISAISQDMRGYLWIGTNNGISLYDGITFHAITPRDGLANEYISGIIPSHHDSNLVWIGTLAGGVSRYDRGKFSTISFGTTQDSNNTIPLVEDAAKRLWVATTYNLYVVEEKTPHVLRSFGNQIRGIGAAELDSGRVVVAVNDSFFVYDVRSLAVLSRASINRPPGVVISDLLRTSRGKVWALFSNGDLVAVKDNTLQQTLSFSGLDLLEMYDGKDGSLWLVNRTGVYHLYASEQPIPPVVAHGEHEGFPQFPGLVFVDMERNLWIGTWTQGLAKLSEPSIVTLLPGFANRPGGVIDGTCDTRGHMWMLTENGLIEAVRNKGTWRTFPHDVRALTGGHNVIRVLADNDGRIWMRFEKGSLLKAYRPASASSEMSRLQPVNTIRLDFPDSLIAGLFFLPDSRNRLWCSLEHGGLAVYDIPSGKMLRLFMISDGIPASSIRAIYETREGDIWCGGFVGGLSVLPKGELHIAKMTNYRRDSGLPDDGVRSMVQDSDGRLWVGTRFGGVAFFEGTKFTEAGCNEHLRSNAIWSMAEDNRGRIWLGTDVGLESINRNSQQVLPAKRELTRNIILRSGSYRDRFVWAITPDNAIVYEYAESRTVDVPPPVYIQNVIVNGTSRSINDGAVLTHDENNCVIEYAGISMRVENGIRYQYRLDDIDPDWLPPTDHHSVTYASLEPGAYTFRVRAINSDGVMSTNPASMSFVIAPAVWQRWWFLPLLVLACSGVASVAIRRRFRALERERELHMTFSRQLIESQESERQRIAGELHDSLGQNLLIIKNQAMIGLDTPDKDSPATEPLKTISDIASESITGVREIAYNLRPYLLDKLGLTKGVQSVMKKMSASSSIGFTVAIEDVDGLLPAGHEIHLYRIVQESINNIVRHSGAANAAVRMHQTDSGIVLSITDDGKGFDRTSIGTDAIPGGFGLAGIAERVRILRGDLSIESAPSRGTTLNITIPLV
jgi:signal transduction histidine kinase/ligand-binding sensor domain-containing protein